MTDSEFLAQFEAATLHPFTHRDHIRMAWLYLQRDAWGVAYQQIQAGLRYFATSHGVSQKYHETITRFWASLVLCCMAERPDINDFEVFITTFPILLDKSAMSKHYSADVLRSSEAREHWHEPDLLPMPPRQLLQRILCYR